MNNTEVIKLKITADKINYKQSVNAFPSATKEITDKELMERLFENDKTQVLWSKKEKKAAFRYAYGNEYIRESENKKEKDFLYEEEFESEQQFNELYEELRELQRSEIFSGKFTERAKLISVKMSEARK